VGGGIEITEGTRWREGVGRRVGRGETEIVFVVWGPGDPGKSKCKEEKKAAIRDGSRPEGWTLRKPETADQKRTTSKKHQSLREGRRSLNISGKANQQSSWKRNEDSGG